MNLEKFYINGEWVDPKKSETIDIINPADETIIGKLNVIYRLFSTSNIYL